MENIYGLACRLAALPSVSGNEDMAFDGLKDICGDMFDEIVTLPTGSFIGIKKCGKENAKKILLDAHLDQIGFVVNGYAGAGFLKVAAVGGIDTRVLCANKVHIHCPDGTIEGVISSVSPHLRQGKNANAPIKLESLSISTYLDEEELKKKVPIGTPVSFNATPVLLLNDRMASPQMDDKICIASILLAVEMLKDCELNVDIYAHFAGGEEIGYIGARTGGWYIDPDYAIALDVCNAYGPDMPDWRKDCLMGEGCTVSYSATADRKFTKKLIQTAKDNNIKIQLLGEPSHTGTDTHALALVREGVPAALISIPLRSMHTYTEVISLRDVEAAAHLLAEVIKNMEVKDNA
ncbi:MAG: M42 family metallopeptidase [Ruminococcaceae bacterium]|nr:M42 family metallopeptidase [Oscillospiraceae bacterium]